MTRVTQLIHDAGKYLLISVYPLPTHPTHNFTHTNGGNLETLPGWPKKLQHNRPARSAGQWGLVYCSAEICYSGVKFFLCLMIIFRLSVYKRHSSGEWLLSFTLTTIMSLLVNMFPLTAELFRLLKLFGVVVTEIFYRSCGKTLALQNYLEDNR